MNTPSDPAADLWAINDLATDFYRAEIRRSWVPDYLQRRGFSLEVQDFWQIGYAPAGWDTLTSYLRAAGFDDSKIVTAGLARRNSHGTLTDAFRDRLMIPIRSTLARTAAFIGRASPKAHHNVPKYLNNTSTLLYRKSSTLFGLAEARYSITAGATPVIAEGPLDAMAIATAAFGRYAPVAPCGTALTAQHVAALDDAHPITDLAVVVAFDADSAGYRAAVNAYHHLSPVCASTISVVFPPGQDPADVLYEHGPQALGKALDNRRRPLADLVINGQLRTWRPWLHHAEGQIAALRAIAPVIAAMPPSDVARQVGRLSARLNLDHATITEAVTTALTRPPPAPGAGPADVRPHQALSKYPASRRSTSSRSTP
jgi:DNA primase